MYHQQATAISTNCNKVSEELIVLLTIIDATVNFSIASIATIAKYNQLLFILLVAIEVLASHIGTGRGNFNYIVSTWNINK